MDEFFEVLTIIVLLCIMVVMVWVVITAPFAFIGFIILASINVFGDIATIGYVNSTVIGFFVVLFVGVVYALFNE
jgi:hypothetical protein